MNSIKLGIVSDLHTDHWDADDLLKIGNLISENTREADIILLAGDIGSGSQAVRTASFLFPDKPVCMVAGNHEFYGGVYDTVRQEMAAAAAGTNVTLLDRTTFTTAAYGTPIRILGATLWTNFDLYGARFLSMVIAGQHIQTKSGVITCFPDFWSIYKNEQEWIKPDDMLAWHVQDWNWIQQELDTPFDGLTVLMTHHAPVSFANNPFYEGSPTSPCFLSRLDDKLIRDDLALVNWGHVHYSIDRTIENTRFVSNQVGYLGRRIGRSGYTETDNFGVTVVLNSQSRSAAAS